MVIAPGVPADKHLANRSAMHEDNSGPLISGFCSFGEKKLAMNFESVRSLEYHLLRFDQIHPRKLGWNGFGCDKSLFPSL
ncbi:hypothetical protein ES703_116837 [subsurface metagenome]